MGSGDDSRESSRAADQVGLARDWLLSHGVEPPPSSDGPRGAADRLLEVEGDVRDDPRAGVEGRAAPGVEGGVLAAGPDDGPSDDDADVPSARRGRAGRRGGRGRAAGDGSGRDHERPARGSGGLDPDADPEEVARTIVLRKLAAQARTRTELARALKTREVPEAAANAVLDRMTEVGLVDDATFAHDWVASRQQRRHLSRTALRRELQTKGVDRDLIDDALSGVEVDDEHRAALDLARRRAASMAGLERDVAYRRLGGVLARRGFSSSVTVQVITEVLDELREGSRPD